MINSGGKKQIQCLKTLWTEVCNIVQEAVTKTIAKRKIYPTEYKLPEYSKER